MTKYERVTAMFSAIDADGQDFIFCMLEAEYERVQRVRRPVLRLIQGGPPTAGSIPKPRATTRTKRKEQV